MADLDHLTQLLSRREFDAAFATRFSESADDAPLALVMSDIDHFKKINDSHGHTAGDAALRLVAAEIGRVVQGKGNAFRYGGEEFALILPNHSCDEALAVAERARRAIEVVRSTNHNMTCSFGVAVAPIHAAGRDDLLRRADEALYDAKKLGRNLVRLSGEPPPSATATESSRQVSRRAPDPGTISDEAREQLRREILRHGGAHSLHAKMTSH